MSRFSKAIRPIRKIIHQTPIISSFASGFAHEFGLGSQYDAFDAEIGLKGPSTDASIGNYAADVLLSQAGAPEEDQGEEEQGDEEDLSEEDVGP